MKRAARIERRKRIALAYAIALGADLIPLPRVTAVRAVRAVVPDVTESEIFAAVRWGLQRSKRSGAKFERAISRERRRDAEKTARQDDDYDPSDDFSRSLEDCYAATPRLRARLTTEFERTGRPRPNNWQPAEPDPGPGWLRSRFMGRPWPRPGVVACGRPSCPICALQASQKLECAPIEPEARERSPATSAPPHEPDAAESCQITDDIETQPAIQQLRGHFHIYEGASYFTLRCGICGQMFDIQPNVAILERDSFQMLLGHARAHGEMPGPLTYSGRWRGERA